MLTSEIKRKLNLPFLGRGILGSGWQRQTCPESSPDPVDEALRGALELIGLSLSIDSLPFTSTSKLVESRFLVARGEVAIGDGRPSSLVRWTGLEAGAIRLSWILLLFRKFREQSTPSIGECEASSSICMFDLTYLLGMLKNVATGGVGEDRMSGGSTRLANILDEFDAGDLLVL